MSNYPDGMKAAYYAPIDMECHDCGHAFEVSARHEMGSVEVKDSDLICPFCGSLETT